MPDIEYSVEMMLHNSNENDGNNAYALYKNGGDKYASHIVLQDGRKFRLDEPGDKLKFIAVSTLNLNRSVLLIIIFFILRCLNMI